jgi:lipid-A-disaccharide synthase-like uncharacterized protein
LVFWKISLAGSVMVLFSYSKSQIDNVVKYILNQKEHHQKKSFRQEYLEFLEN